MWWKTFFDDLIREGYKFHFSDDDNLDSTINLDYRFPNIVGVKDFKREVKSKLDQIIKEEDIQIVFPIANMGESIFLSLVGFFPPKKIQKVENYQMEKQIVENKNILIFDDSIKTGSKIRSEIEKTLIYKPNKVVVFSLVSRSDTCLKLDTEYSNNKKIKIVSIVTIPKDFFTDFWRVLIWPFIEYHGLPLLETPYVVGEINSVNNLKELYRRIVIDKKSAASIINPTVVDESLVVKGSINYTKFVKNLNKDTNIHHTKLFLRFFFLRLTPAKFIFIIYPDLSFCDLEIDEKICSNGSLFSICFKNEYNGEKVCFDCVLFNLCKEINDHIYKICSDSLDISKLRGDHTEFLERYYSKLLGKHK